MRRQSKGQRRKKKREKGEKRHSSSPISNRLRGERKEKRKKRGGRDRCFFHALPEQSTRFAREEQTKEEKEKKKGKRGEGGKKSLFALSTHYHSSSPSPEGEENGFRQEKR